MTKLVSPRLVALVDLTPDRQEGELTEFDIQTDNRDSIQWDITRTRKGWPPLQEAALLWLTFMAWHALHRSGAITLTLDQFMAQCVQVGTFNAQGERLAPGTLAGADLTPLDPTQPVATTGQ